MSWFCDQSLPEGSVYRFLHRERDRLFPDEMFADLFEHSGRRSVPPSVVATVMVLQRLEGRSDREAVERYAFDSRWRYAAGVGSYDTGGWGRFAHTVLVDMRERLRRSDDKDRIFRVGLEAAREAGMIGLRRVLDSTPLYDAVATMDTVTLIRSALRGLLAAADSALEAELRAVADRSGEPEAARDGRWALCFTPWSQRLCRCGRAACVGGPGHVGVAVGVEVFGLAVIADAVEDKQSSGGLDGSGLVVEALFEQIGAVEESGRHAGIVPAQHSPAECVVPEGGGLPVDRQGE